MDPDLEIPSQLYESEISFSISCVWNNGFDIALGWESNVTATGHAESYIEACTWVRMAALKHYPDSAFSKKHGHGLRLVPAKGDKAELKVVNEGRE